METMLAKLDAIPKQPRPAEANRLDGVDASGGPTVAVARDNFNLNVTGRKSTDVEVLGITSDVFPSQSSQAISIDKPHISLRKGRTSKRFKGAIEQIRGGLKRCSGCNKLVVGYDKRNCPAFNVPTTSFRSESINDACIYMGQGRGLRGGHK